MCEIANGVEVAWFRRDATHVAGYRLDDDTGNLVATSFQYVCESGFIIERSDNRVSGKVGRNAGAVGRPESRQSRARLYQQAVAVTVIATLEFHDAVTASEPAGQSQRAHGRFCARADQTNTLD